MNLAKVALPAASVRLVKMLRKLEARGFGAATYAFTAKTLGLHPDNAKKAALAASRSSPPVVAIKSGIGRGNKSTVSLTAAGRQLAEQLEAREAARVTVPPSGKSRE